MCPQTVCPRGCIITLVAFVWLFSAVRFQMCPQSACLRECRITLVAFVWLFSTVSFQMCPQIVCSRGCIITLATFVWLFSTVRFQMCSRIAFPRECIVRLVVFVWHRQVIAYKIFLHPNLSWKRVREGKGTWGLDLSTTDVSRALIVFKGPNLWYWKCESKSFCDLYILDHVFKKIFLIPFFL